MTITDAEAQPLLSPATSSSSSSSSTTLYSNNFGKISRRIEDDVLPEASSLGRTLSWQSAYILVISRVIGSGIFATPGSIVRAVGSPGLALVLWVVGAAVAACGLAVSLEFGSMLPRSGGDKVYLEFTYRRPRFLASTLVAVHVVLLGFTASNCIVFSQYVLFALGQEQAGDGLRKGLAVALLAAVTGVHAVFPKTGVRLQNVLGWVKVGIIIFMILSGLYVVLLRPEQRLPAQGSSLAWNTLWEHSNWNWGIIATSLFKVFYSFAGLDNANNVLNEVKDPVRTLRSVTFTALITACGLYLLINVAYFIVVPIDEIKESGELIAALFFERIFGPGARLKQEIARQGFLPFSEILSTTRPFNSPIGGLAVHFVPSLLVITLPPSREVYSFILEVEGYPGQFFSLAVASGLVWLRFKRPDLKRPFKVWLPAVVLKICLSLSLLAAPFFPPPNRREGELFYATYAIVGVSM
ncbi:Low-affinity methionine permease like protein [Verticillium longisporum]|uniref:Low-affinity methionine permease like protein n=1 Tax=Verticillium longisporum TaxID=100787 RepID=A0A8I2ZWT2_VERLO|nr:Low-affinity methionine permease like protein [Verticillium longisporum]